MMKLAVEILPDAAAASIKKIFENLSNRQKNAGAQNKQTDHCDDRHRHLIVPIGRHNAFRKSAGCVRGVHLAIAKERLNVERFQGFHDLKNATDDPEEVFIRRESGEPSPKGINNGSPFGRGNSHVNPSET